MSLLKRTRAIVATVVHQLLGNTETINSQSIIVLEKDSAGFVTRCKGTVTVTDAGAGYAKGCIYVKTDGATATTVFINEGSTTSCDFNAIESSASTVTGVTAGDGLTGGGTEGTVSLAVNPDNSTLEINADAVRVKDAGITAAKLATAVAGDGLVNTGTSLATGVTIYNGTGAPLTATDLVAVGIFNGVNGISVALADSTIGPRATHVVKETIAAGATWDFASHLAIAPTDASVKWLLFSSATPGKATVDQNGLVTGVAAGTSVITATTVDGGFSVTATVTVTA